jgi:hypothetical protein
MEGTQLTHRPFVSVMKPCTQEVHTVADEQVTQLGIKFMQREHLLRDEGKYPEVQEIQ